MIDPTPNENKHGELGPELNLTRAVHTRLLETLYSRGPYLIAVLVVLLPVIRWALAPAYSEEPLLKLLFWVFLGSCLVGAALVGVLPGLYRQRLGYRLRLLFYILPAAGISLSLSLSALAAFPHLGPERFAIFAFVVAVIVASAIFSLGAHLPSFFLLALPPLASLLALLATDRRPDWGAAILATAIVVFGLAAASMSLIQHRTLWHYAQLTMRLEEQAMRDGLTNLHNRRFLHEYMDRETRALKRAWFDIDSGRFKPPDTFFGIFILDLDFFKGINDNYGHSVGDEVLAGLSRMLAEAMRQTDLVVRWGGDEFVVISAVRDVEDLGVVAVRLLRILSNFRFQAPDAASLARTVSCGFCIYPFQRLAPFEFGWEQALSLADAGLHLAKLEGRHRAVGVVPGSRFSQRPGDFFNICLKELVVGEREAWIRLLRVLPAGSMPAGSIPAGSVPAGRA